MVPLDLQTKAFNRGCDARLAGQGLSSDPYDRTDLSNCWRHGWIHADATWGRDARWPHMPLPPVKPTLADCLQYAARDG